MFQYNIFPAGTTKEKRGGEVALACRYNVIASYWLCILPGGGGRVVAPVQNISSGMAGGLKIRKHDGNSRPKSKT
jgi:hypothetical protein